MTYFVAHVCSTNSISPDGWISFVGNILGAVATIIAVILTIKFEISQSKKHDIISAKPWITSNFDLLTSISAIQKLKSENATFVYLTEGSWGSTKEVPYYITEDYVFNNDRCIVKYEFENAGANSATCLDFCINNSKLFPLFALPVNKKKTLVLVLPLMNNEKTEFQLSFNYGDVVSKTKYRQQETLTVIKENNGVTLIQEIDDMLSEPEILGGEKEWIN